MYKSTGTASIPRSKIGRFANRSKSTPELHLSAIADQPGPSVDEEALPAGGEAAVNTNSVAAEYRTLGNEFTDTFDVFARINVLQSALRAGPR